ncbi:MAG: hypothetical protein ACYDHP_13720, partial [Ferrimicrobium sp.]
LPSWSEGPPKAHKDDRGPFVVSHTLDPNLSTWGNPGELRKLGCGARVHDSSERSPYLLVRTSESYLIHRKGEGLEESGGMTKNSPRRGTSSEAA